MAEAIRVDFGQPMPVFPLPEAVLLPHAIQPLRVFEPRYTKLVDDCLEGPGQMAVASFAGEDWKTEHTCSPTLRPAVCVGQIVQHEPASGGRHDILVQGICRAKILRMIEPENGHDYRSALLAPLEPPSGKQSRRMTEIRGELREMLNGPRLCRLRSVETVMTWFEREDVSTQALLELIGFALLRDSELKYRLLAEASAVRRAGIIKHELVNLDHLVQLADRQPYRAWPKGMSWN